MKVKKIAELILILGISISVILVGCGSGGGGSSDDPVSFPDLSKSTMIFNETPTQNEELIISLDEEGDIGQVEWTIVTEPVGSNLVLTSFQDGKSVSFTPVIAGEYKIRVVSVSNSSEQGTNLVIDEEFQFDTSKVEGYDGVGNIEEIIGAIQNQIWVYSASLTENEVRNIVAQYPEFTVVGYDEVQGLLAEFDEQSTDALEAIEELKLEKGIDSVDNRVHEGKEVPRDLLTTPDDGSAFNDGGDNWHLEYINMQEAWDYSTGTDNFLIGVSDKGFNKKHEDIRIVEILTKKTADHGNGVVGTIGAISNNQKGISGINWKTGIIAGKGGSTKNLKNVLIKDKDGKKVMLANNSWSMPNYPPSDFDPTDQKMVEKRLKKARRRTVHYRKLALNKKYKDKLQIWAAGNGVGNGISSSGFYGVDAKFHNGAIHLNSDGNIERLDNVIVVGAIVSDGRLWALSEFGSTVDIVAPTRFKSLKSGASDYYESWNSYGSNESAYGSWSGTSAAAPVVTGVASLIYSLYSGFSPKDVKDILISSATTKVAERYKAPGGAGNNNSNIEALAHEIPILNAAKALEKAQEIINSKVKISHSYPDPFTAEASIQFESLDSDLEVAGIEFQIQSSTSGQGDGDKHI